MRNIEVTFHAFDEEKMNGAGSDTGWNLLDPLEWFVFEVKGSIAMLSIRLLVCACAMVAVAAAQPARAQFGQPDPAPVSALTIPQEKMVQADALNELLKAHNEKLVVLQVGSHVMFVQAHIPGSLYAGPSSDAEGQHLLHTRVANLPKNTRIVIYCGCCPWNRCPNVGPAYAHLMHMGFTNVRVLYIANNFGADWVGKGYAVEKGE